MSEIDWSQYRNFTRSEFVCRCGCGRADMDPQYMDRLQKVRTASGLAMKISSGYRCPEHDRDVGGKGEHTTGMAADVLVFGDNVAVLIMWAALVGFQRFGAKQHGPRGRRFVHIGGADDARYRPAFWTYRGRLPSGGG